MDNCANNPFFCFFQYKKGKVIMKTSEKSEKRRRSLIMRRKMSVALAAAIVAGTLALFIFNTQR